MLKGQAYPKWSDVIVKAFPKMQLPMFGNTKTLCQDEREKERERVCFPVVMRLRDFFFFLHKRFFSQKIFEMIPKMVSLEFCTILF